MRKEDVPQDSGVLEDNSVVAYALDDDGKYCLAATSGWNPVNEANQMAWEDIHRQLDEVRDAIAAGKKSILAYYMTRAQMDVALLAGYAGLSRWRVRRHLRPGSFQKLGVEQQNNYARLFNISVQQLSELPVDDALPMDGDSKG
ncbi:MAG: hypothetical protein U9R29_03060 [Thermodesulfobacteriota bacterium]|nr:hypothetical protein [Thermodesulfobacteriota bacterium]